MTSNATTSNEAETRYTETDKAARDAIRAVLDGSPIAQRPADEYGRWFRHVQALNQTYQERGVEAVEAAYDALARVKPDLHDLVRDDDDAPLAGADERVREILGPGCSREMPELPSVEEARDLRDLRGFINYLMVAPGLKQRDRQRAVCHVIRTLLLEQGRVLLDPESGPKPGTLYVVSDNKGVWELGSKSLPVKAVLGKTGLNASETVCSWLLDDLDARYEAVPNLPVSRFWTTRKGSIYVSCGPTRLVKGHLDGGQVHLRSLANGADDVWFASDAVIPEWELADDPVSPLTLAAFQPALVTPRSVSDYTPEVQGRLLSAWLPALVGGVRPLPIVAALGNRGGGKTNLIRGVTRAVLLEDPTTLSSDRRDMWTLASDTPLLALDNVDSVPPPWFADFLAALATGVAHRRRKLYTDTTTNRAHPNAATLLSSRTAAFARPDVADRTLPIFTGSFKDEERVSDAELILETAERRDQVMTYLLEQAVLLLARLEKAPTLPGRFVDFSRVVWAHSPETATRDLRALQQAQSLTVGDADPVIASILDDRAFLLGAGGRWEGTPTKLKRMLQERGFDVRSSLSGRAIARSLREGADTLRQFGIRLEDKTSGNNTIFTLTEEG